MLLPSRSTGRNRHQPIGLTKAYRAVIGSISGPGRLLGNRLLPKYGGKFTKAH